MAECATRVMTLNGVMDRVKLIRKRSTYVEVGPGKDMEHRANILVTEVLDTELIGEGAIGTYNHAHENLLTVTKFSVAGALKKFKKLVPQACLEPGVLKN